MHKNRVRISPLSCTLIAGICANEAQNSFPARIKCALSLTIPLSLVLFLQHGMVWRYFCAHNSPHADKLPQACKFLEIILHTMDFQEKVGQGKTRYLEQPIGSPKARHCWFWNWAKQRLREVEYVSTNLTSVSLLSLGCFILTFLHENLVIQVKSHSSRENWGWFFPFNTQRLSQSKWINSSAILFAKEKPWTKPGLDKFLHAHRLT